MVFYFIGMEEFRDIKGYEGLYQVSNLGVVKSLSRWRKNGNGGYITKDKFLKNKISTSNSRMYVHLVKNNKQKAFKIHQLVAIGFLNHTPNGFNGVVVDHIDNNPLNNKLDNLQLITQRENASKDKKGGTSKYLGVCWRESRGHYQSAIKINNKTVFLGSFKEELKACNIYKKALSNLDKYNGNNSEFRVYLNSL
jgi:hypothetical protein